jgi:predicted dehydrogenase
MKKTSASIIKNTIMEKDNSRRKFITTSAIGLTGLLALGSTAFGRNPMPTDIIRLGMIGTGARGVGLATLIKAMPGVTLIACCDTIPEHLANGMKQAAEGAKAYTDYRKLLEEKTIDAVIIATPLYLHYGMAIDAVQAGKHIYLEKSMAFDIPQTLDLVKKISASKLVFQVGFQYRYYGLYQKIKQVIDQNWLGKVTHFECQYNQNSNWRKPVSKPEMERAINWRMYRQYCGGPLSELCAHQIDMVNYILGSHPLKVTGIGGIDYWKDGRDTFDNIRTIYEYPNGVKSSVTSVLSNAYNGYNIKILGDKGTIEIQRDKAFIYAESVSNKRGTVDGVTGATIAAKTQGKAEELSFDEPGGLKLEPTTYCLQSFFDCIKNNTKPLSNVLTARDTSIAIHLGNKAADTEMMQNWKPEYSI